MRIAFVTDVVYPYVKGGAEKRIYEFSKRLTASGHEVHIYSARWWDGPRDVVMDGIVYHGVCKPHALYRNGRRSIIEAILFGFSLVLPLMKEKFDVIDCNQHPYFSIFPCRLATIIKGGRLFVTWHEVWDDYWYEYLGKKGFFGRVIEKITAGISCNIISVSRRTATRLRKIGVREQDITIVPNGISLSSIDSIDKADDAYDVIFAGRLISDKHVDVLLKACARIAPLNPGLKVLIVGDGPEKLKLERLAGRLKVAGNVRLAGPVDDNALISYLKASKVFVLPSTREGFGITALEALACGTPVITVDTEMNSAQELICNGTTGYVVHLDEEDIGEGILRILNEERRELMAKQCIASARTYDWDRLADELMLCYSKQ